MNALRKAEFVHQLNAPRQQFVENIRANIRNHGVPSLKIRRAMLVCGGPSAADHVEEIRRKKAEGWELFTVNGAHDWLIGLGLYPSACAVMDAGKVVDTFIQKPQRDCTYYLASQTHPDLFSRLVRGGFNVVMFHAALDEETNSIIEQLDPNPTINASAPTVGLHSLHILYTLGVKKLHVYGMDSSHRGGADHAYDNSQQGYAPVFDFYFQDKPYRSTPTWASQAQTFARFWKAYFDLGMRIEVFGDGLLPAMARHAKALAMRELQRVAEQPTNPRTDHV